MISVWYSVNHLFHEIFGENQVDNFKNASRQPLTEMRPFGDVCMCAMCGLSFVIRKETGTIFS